MKEPFSRQRLIEAGPGDPAPVETLEASDGVALAYRIYRAAEPRAVLIFHHGGGAHSGAGYAHLAAGLRDGAGIVVYTPDLRGPGASQGAPGDAPTTERLFEDVEAFVSHARTAWPDLPLFLGGHSSGGGLVLNYSSWEGRGPVAGYVLLSPQLGFRSDTEREPGPEGADTPPFAEVSLLPFVVHAMTGGWLMGHREAVRFNYPSEILDADPGMVSGYTVNFANGVTPQAPFEQFAALDAPVGLWIGGDDELFEPEAVVAFVDLATSVRAASTAAVLPGGTHLGVLVDAHEAIGPWLTSRAAGVR